tara:strand:- start:1023 stop:1325 length:303 start_codon:yes stop_codon:yes gene_type:complete
MAATAIFNPTWEHNPVAEARKTLLQFPLWKLQGAEVKMYEGPDTTNPSGLFDLWVVLEYKTWLGIKRSKIVYFERSSDDDWRQCSVFGYIQEKLERLQLH